MIDLGELFRIARQYGRVMIYTFNDGKYHAKIEFDTIRHTTLEASSRHDCASPEDAVRAAIEVAEKIVESFAAIPKRRLLGES